MLPKASSKASFLLVVLVAASLVLPVVAHAQASTPQPQGGFELPDTAVEAVGLLLTFIASFLGVGTITNVFVDALKKVNLPFLGPEKTHQLAGLLAEIAVVVIAGLLSWAATLWLYPWARWLDAVGVWPIWAAAAPFARWLYWQHKQAQFKAGL